MRVWNTHLRLFQFAADCSPDSLFFYAKVLALLGMQVCVCERRVPLRFVYVTAYHCPNLQNDWWAFPLPPSFYSKGKLTDIYSDENKWPNMAVFILESIHNYPLLSLWNFQGQFLIPERFLVIPPILQGHFPLISQLSLREYQLHLISD